MKINYRILCFALILSSPFLTAGSKEKNIESQPVRKTITVEVSSLDDLMALFDKYNYNKKSWAAGNREVPRITFDSVSENWKNSSKEIPIPLKKQVFFRLMAPLVLISNENISNERKAVKNLPLDDQALIVIAKKYRVIEATESAIDEKKRQELLVKVDIVPPSLALAQAAEESGWATSRFTSEGNALFGQWDFSGKGMAPKQQRKELGNYGLARFNSPLASVEGYMRNINTTNAYHKFRALRSKLHHENKPLTGLVLAGTLDKYSERGHAYIDSIRSMIRYNKLQDVDEAYLSNEQTINLINKGG